MKLGIKSDAFLLNAVLTISSVFSYSYVRLSPRNLTIPENTDVEFIVADITATRCCDDKECCDWDSGEYRCDIPCPNCANCSCSVDTSNAGRFSVFGNNTVKKLECSSPGCGKTCSQKGCVNAGEVYTLNVTCNSQFGEASETLEVKITENSPPTFEFRDGSSINVNKTAQVGSMINHMSVTDQENDVITYTLKSGPGISYIRGHVLFTLDTTNGDIKVASDLSDEFSYYYSMEVCVEDRRSDPYCKVLNITLDACFQTPNCTDKKVVISDTRGTAHENTALIWTMKADPPSGHFVNFSPNWQNFRWKFVNNPLDSSTYIDKVSGAIMVTNNISIHPAYPSATYVQTVQVSNDPFSCHTTSCTMTITVLFTNWDIEIRNLPASTSLHEDHDNKTHLLDLEVYDYNYDKEDNVTCRIVSVNPDEKNMFSLEDDRQHTERSYKLYKLECQTPNCGYKGSGFLCELNKGCMNHNITQSYHITITCIDAYGSNSTGVFTFNVVKNVAPQYQNLPRTIQINTEVTSQFDTIYSILYSDDEDEDLFYEYKYMDRDDFTFDPNYFLGSTQGNFGDNLANITMTTYLHDKPVNKTYIIQVCGHERRNEICEDLTVELAEYCGPTPKCSSSEMTINSSYAGDLFRLDLLVQKATSDNFESLSYAITSVYSEYFTVDPITGVVSINGKQRVAFPSVTYTVNAYVFDKNACGYGHCVLTVIVNYLNEPIFITNLPSAKVIHEDDRVTTTIFAIETTDANDDDTVTCAIDTPTSVEPFYITETIDGSEKYVIKIRVKPVFSSAMTTYSIHITCRDAHGSTDSESLTITVEKNKGPIIDNLAYPRQLNLNPYDYSKGSIIDRVTAKDTEGDRLTFSCNVKTSRVPLSCQMGSNTVYITLRRAVDPVVENGASYDIEVFVSDAKHYNHSNITVRATFTNVKTAPEIYNLPSTTSVPENAAVGTTLFRASITDPDVGETHRVTMTVYPTTERSTFILKEDGTLILAKTLNYERLKSYNIVFNVQDNFLQGLTEKVLTLDVEDVNEGNTLKVSKSSITFPETKAANTKLEKIGLTCTGEDVGDTLTYSLHTEKQDFFSINGQTGEITLLKAWDLESGLPSSTTLYITCSDQQGLNSTVAVTVNIEDVNEYKPQLVLLSGNIDTPIQMNSSTSLATTFLSFQVHDEDYNNENNFVAKIVGNGLGQKYFRIVANKNRKRSSGVTVFSMKPKAYMKFQNSKQFWISIQFCDVSANPLCNDFPPLKTVYNPSDPDLKTKSSAKCLTCTNNGKALIAVIVIEVLLIIGLVMHAVCSMACGQKNKKTANDQRREWAQKGTAIPSTSSSSNNQQGAQSNHQTVKTEVFQRSRYGSAKSSVSTRNIIIARAAVRRSASVESLGDDSSSSSDECDFEDTEFRKRAQSLSSQISLSALSRTSNKIHPSKHLRKSAAGSRESLYNDLPPPIYSSRVTSGTSRITTGSDTTSAFVASRDGGFPRPVYSSDVVAPLDY